ncbi:hypothetical protein BDR07DRAFT_948897 [Suillus spraguei]|nr:hypothetical protein BDR07DRAFT_948897 [Suillus spraguei]
MPFHLLQHITCLQVLYMKHLVVRAHNHPSFIRENCDFHSSVVRVSSNILLEVDSIWRGRGGLRRNCGCLSVEVTFLDTMPSQCIHVSDSCFHSSPFLSTLVSVFKHFDPLGNLVSWQLFSLHTLVLLNSCRALWCFSHLWYNTFIYYLYISNSNILYNFGSIQIMYRRRGSSVQRVVKK